MLRFIEFDTTHGRFNGLLQIPEENLRGVLVVTDTDTKVVDAKLALALEKAGMALVHASLLNDQESGFPDSGQNIPKLTQRVLDVLNFARLDWSICELPLALLGAGDTTPAVLRAATQRDQQVSTLIAVGGLVDRAGREALDFLAVPALLLHSPDDEAAQSSLERALPHLHNSPVCELKDGADQISPRILDWLGDWLNKPRPA